MSRRNFTLVKNQFQCIDELFSRFFFAFSKLINVAVPKTIDERAINLNFSKQDIFRQSENLELGKNFEMIRKIKTQSMFLFSDQFGTWYRL